MILDLNPLLRGWGNYYAIGHVQSLFEELDKWIRMRLRSKVRGSKARTISNAKLPTRTLERLGLVSLGSLRRARLSPA
jgi:hypothetical protein